MCCNTGNNLLFTGTFLTCNIDVATTASPYQRMLVNLNQGRDSFMIDDVKALCRAGSSRLFVALACRARADGTRPNINFLPCQTNATVNVIVANLTAYDYAKLIGEGVRCYSRQST